MITYEEVERGSWRDTVASAADDGWDYLDLLTAIDDVDRIRVVAHVVRVSTWEGRWFSTALDPVAAVVDSIVTVLPAATWHERETAEMFGVRFQGHPDPRPLLLSPDLGIHPLRKEAVLVARVARPWPGAAEGKGSGRRGQPVGAPREWLVDADDG